MKNKHVVFIAKNLLAVTILFVTFVFLAWLNVVIESNVSIIPVNYSFSMDFIKTVFFSSIGIVLIYNIVIFIMSLSIVRNHNNIFSTVLCLGCVLFLIYIFMNSLD